MTDLGTGPDNEPMPGGGWSEQIVTLRNARVVPPVESALVQKAGILKEDGTYCREGALWRRFRPITIAPDQPKAIRETISGRWLWGGVLWVHFGHFLVESSSRLWALAHLDQPVDGVLFIPKRPSVGGETRGFQRDFIDLFAPGMPIRVAAEPSEVEELVVPGQGFGLGQITQGTRKFRSAIHSGFARDVKPEGPGRIYISRSKLGLSKGGLLGEEQMEERLRGEGYEIFHPQEHSLREQLARYKAAKHVIAADGSAIHLYAMVGRPDQKVAIVLRRRSGANNLLASNVAHFCRCNPVVIGALRTEWVPKNKPTSNRNSFGEIDHAVIGRALAQHGFIAPDAQWPVLSDVERSQILMDKGFGGGDRFVESPEFKQQRVREMRRARRAARSAP